MPKKILTVATSLMLAASFVSAHPIPTRGIIEGFYGQPWSHAQRLDALAFAAKHNLNAYIYAPKDDPYHRSKWREPYPSDQLDQIRRLIDASAQNNVEFIFAVSPGLDLTYSDDDLNAMISKLDSIHALGCNHFAVFFDDIKDHNGAAQAQFLNRLENSFVNVNPNVKHLITVPTEYYRRDMLNADGSVKDYTRNFTAALDKNILVLYTGDGVVVPTITDDQLLNANQLYDRQLGVWWNYPVNDYMPSKLALGPVEALPTNLPAIFFNPMSAYELSKITLSTGAAWALDPINYDPQRAWQQAIEEQFGALSNEMMLFAEHSQHMQNDWARAGRADAPNLRAELDRLINGEDRSEVIEHRLVETSDAVRKLKSDLPPKIRQECQAQLDQLERLIEAAQIGVDIVKYERRGAPTDQLRQMLEGRLWTINQHWEEARLSEDCLYRFVKTVSE